MLLTHNGHNARVTFLAPQLMCTIFIVPRTTIYEIRGDFREPETNPDYYLIALSRSERLEGFAESLILRKLFDAWSGRILPRDAEEAIVQDDQSEEEVTSLLWPVRSGFCFSAVPYGLFCEDPDAADVNVSRETKKPPSASRPACSIVPNVQ
jgi:hypothetical protein